VIGDLRRPSSVGNMPLPYMTFTVGGVKLSLIKIEIMSKRIKIDFKRSPVNSLL